MSSKQVNELWCLILFWYRSVVYSVCLLNSNLYVLLDCDGVLETEFLLPPSEGIVVTNGVNNGEVQIADNDGVIDSTSPSIDEDFAEDDDFGKSLRQLCYVNERSLIS